MSKLYHPGAYGSIRKERWSCCERAGATADGCEPCSSGNGNKEIGILIMLSFLVHTRINYSQFVSQRFS